jgi:hypothetical protein
VVIRFAEMWDLTMPLATTASIAEVAAVLADSGVNIDSVCCAGAASQGLCHLLVGDREAAATALAAAGTIVQVRPVAVFTLENRPGTLARVMAAINAAKIDVDFVYQATDRGLVIGAGDTDAVRAAVLAVGQA